VRRFLLVLIALAVVSVAVAPSALATTVSCGQVITANTTVDNDLTCPDDGLIIGAHDITLDLNGHAVGGSSIFPSCPGPQAGPDFGIEKPGYDGVTIENGFVSGQGFNVGIALNGADRNVIRNITVGDTFCEQISLINSDDALIEDNHLDGEPLRGPRVREIGIDDSSGARVERNQLDDSLHAGIQLTNTSQSRIAGNTLTSMADFGIELLSGSSNNVVSGNGVHDQGFDGIVAALGANDNLIEKNTVSGTGDDPEPSEPGQWALIEVEDSARNRIRQNVLSNSGSPGVAINVGSLNSAFDRSGNVVSDNDIRNTGSDGIVVGAHALQTRVERNYANKSGDDGIDVEVASTTITANSTSNNDSLGIEAVAGVTDGGGNLAAGNGDARQCLNVACAADRTLFGKTALGAFPNRFVSNSKYGSRYYLVNATPVSVTRLRVYLDGRGAATGSQVLRGLIYRHTASGPGALVARTFSTTVKAGQSAGWVSIYFPYPPELKAGSYWLTLQADTGGVARYFWDPKTAGQRTNADLFSDGPANPFGASSSADREMSIYAAGR
jgi:parallel beta-helix repeat protein